MREYEIKIANVKKSCDTARKVAKFLSVFFAVVTVLLLVGSIVLFANKGELNNYAKVENINGRNMACFYNNEGNEVINISQVDKVADYGILGALNVMNMLIGKGMVAEALGVSTLSMAASLAIFVVVLFMIMNVFKMIENSDTPFDESIMKKIKTVFGLITIVVFFSVGLGAAVLVGVGFWSMYCILDYGYVLQKEADETL